MIGKTVTDDRGRTFICIWVEPYLRKDGEPSAIIHWEGCCQVCGEEIGFKTGFTDQPGKYRQNCDRHRMWRQRDGQWFAGQFSREPVQP